MPRLADPDLELLARELAAGASVARAYSAACRDEAIDLVEALRIAELPELRARVAELLAADQARALIIAEWKAAKRERFVQAGRAGAARRRQKSGAQGH